MLSFDNMASKEETQAIIVGQGVSEVTKTTP